MYKAQWRQVQVLADSFWKKWQREYLQCLQPRQKWRQDRPNVKQGDIVLLKEKHTLRNEWPKGIIIEAIEGTDGRVRKVVVRTIKDGTAVSYTRPITEIVVLLSE